MTHNQAKLASPCSVIERIVSQCSPANSEHTVDLLVELADRQNSWCSATLGSWQQTRCHLHLRLFFFFLRRQVHLWNSVNRMTVSVCGGDGTVCLLTEVQKVGVHQGGDWSVFMWHKHRCPQLMAFFFFKWNPTYYKTLTLLPVATQDFFLFWHPLGRVQGNKLWSKEKSK